MFLLHLITSKYDKTNSHIETEIFFADSPTKPFQTNEYSYDADDQIKKINITDEFGKTKITTYTYGYTDQLLTEVLPNGTSIEYNYDDLGNRVSKKVTKNGVTTSTSYTFNGANQISSDGKNTFTYDENGNLSNDGRYQYTWNAFNQLTTVKTAAGVAVANYKYDENGRRIYSKLGTNETYYRYDGLADQVLFEEDASGVITKAYTYDGNGHPLTMMYKGATYYYLTNYRGDVLALTDVNGKVVAEYTYDAWGNILTQTGTMASINPYRYAGYRYDEDTKLYYLMSRYYNPDTGVFLSLDPMRGNTMSPVTLNGYNYVSNNPVMMVDPDGEFAFLLRVFWGAAVGAFVNALTYYIDLIADYGIKKAHKKIDGKKLSILMARGAVSGAIGGGLVSAISKKYGLKKFAEKVLAFNFAPAAYALSSIGDFSVRGVAENQVLSLFGNTVGIIYSVRKELKKIIARYR